MEFRRINSLPPYVFAMINTLKAEARRTGADVIDFGFGNPDLPTDATLFYQGNDSELGQLSKYARIREHDHSE